MPNPGEPVIVSLGVIARFVRLRFIPIMIAPVVLGAAAAWSHSGSFNQSLFLIALLGSISLHLAANAIDDVYDHLNGVDSASEKLFPKDFPGWKPVTRGSISLRAGFAISALLYLVSIAAGLYLSFLVGWYAIAIAIPGIVLSYFYTAPPLKLDYRGLGLGELSILISFGPIPSLGAYYVLTGSLWALPVLAAIPSGLLTVNILLSHDMIFADAYRASGKRSLATVVGRTRTAALVLALGTIAYLMVAAMTLLRYLPITSFLVVLALPLFFKGLAPRRGELPPPEYGKKTIAAFLHSTAFTLLLALGLVV